MSLTPEEQRALAIKCGAGELSIKYGLDLSDVSGVLILSNAELSAYTAAVEAKERERCCTAIDTIDYGDAPEYRACQEAIRSL